MPTQYKKNPNEDTAYFDGHKVNLIAVPAGTLQLPIHPTSDSGYVVDNNGKKHRVLMATFISGTVDYKSSPTADSAYVTINGQKVKVRLAVKENGTLTLSDKPNVDKGYVVGGDSEKHRVTLINTPTGTLELPNNETDDSAYIIDGDGNKIKVRMFALLSGGYVEVIVKGVSPLSLPDAIADSLSYVKAFGGTEQRNLPDGYIQRQFIYMMDGSYLLTDLVPTYDSKVEMDFQTTSIKSGATSYLGGRSEAYPAGLRLGTGSGNSRVVVTAFSNSAYTAPTDVENNTRYKFTFNNKVATLESGGSTLFTNTFTGENANGAALVINGLNSAGTITPNAEGIYLYSFKAWNAQGELVADYVPAIQKGTVPVVGFYDTVSKTFKTATGGTFAAGGEAVPTPDAPMDIVCNNGVLKARHQSGLPLGYTLLDYIESTGTQYIDTGFMPNQDTSVETKAQLSASSGVRFFAAYGPSSNAPYYGVGFSGSGKWVNQTNASNQVTNVDADTNLHTIYKNKTILYIDGTQIGDSGSGDFTSSYSIYLLAANIGGSVSFISAGKMYYAKIWDDNTLVHNFVPCKNASNVVGMYDTVNDVFYQNAGTGTFTAGTAVSDPVEIYTDGTVETINVHGKNLFDNNSSNFDTGLLVVSGTGNVTSNQNYRTTKFIPLKAGNYVVSGKSSYTDTGTITLRANAYDSNQDVYGTFLFNDTSARGNSDWTRIFTMPIDGYVKISVRITDYDIQLELGSTATEYEPYYDGGTATTEMLLKVGDYQDVQSIIDGVVTRNIGVKVLDGTEAWAPTLYPQTNAYRISWTGATATLGTIRYSGLFCTHFEDGGSASVQTPNKMFFANDLNINFPMTSDFDTIGKCLQWLADQYAAGTPVIVIYPLATPTTESVAGQTLQVADGDNVLEITQASLNGLELEAQYQAAVSLTIQEVQDANLDPNVEVTIN